MLETLRRIVQEVNSARDLPQALSIIVKRVKQAMAVDVCSVYLSDEKRQRHVLMATDGLNPGAVGQVYLRYSEGLISAVAERAEPINLDDAPGHPRYRYVAETGEERFHGFLGVPIIQHRKVLGVLVVRQRDRRRFDEDEVAMLVTLAAQLAGAIGHAERGGGVEGPHRGAGAGGVYYLEGLRGATGVGIGTGVVAYAPAELATIPDRVVSDPSAEEEVFRAAVSAVQQDIKALEERMGDALAAEDRALFDAYILMLGSDSLLGGTIERIRAGNWAPGALRATIAEHTGIFEEMEDAYLRERASDIRDLGRRILMRLQSDKGVVREYPLDTILVGEEVSAAQLAEVPPGRLRGVVSAHGSSSSHVAILARALGVPAVMGVRDLPVARLDGEALVVDGYRGRVYVKPPHAIHAEFMRMAHEEAELVAGLKDLRDLPAETPDGARVPLYVNTGLLADVEQARVSAADGVGLYRTELPFLIRDRFPGEEEQRLLYRQVLEAFAPRPVTLRTLDIGGDKLLPYFPVQEDNPFLGWRGIRITLDHPEIFLTQLRAMLRAAAGLANLQLLLPMISGVEEVDEALTLIRRAHDELREEGEQVTIPKVGVMVEVPSAVYLAGALARRVDFLSIGTNDLTQYMLAVDRNNGRVASLYDALHPAVLRALMQVVDGGHWHGKPVGVCGEMAGDPSGAVLLLGMGIDSLSMNVSSLLPVKWVIRSFTRAQARALLEEVLRLDEPGRIRQRVCTALEQAGLGGLVRAGK
jgi:phosphotransferase system, enzyme I, PtsP